MVTISEISPYVYMATTCYALSALSSDLLFIRASLTFGFFFLVMSSLSGYSLDGSFSLETLNLANGIIDIPMLVNIVLCLLNFFICCRLLDDELPKANLSTAECALYRYFHCRCGLTHLQFRHILKYGKFVDFPANSPIPNVEYTLYLVLEGKVECYTKFDQHQEDYSTFFKRSGEFFDIRLFNILAFPVGFDSHEFKAKTVTRAKLFCWNVDGLAAMRDSASPLLRPFWELIVLRSLTNSAVRHFLQDSDRLYDSWQVPEDPSWLEGAPSRDFRRVEKPVGNWEHVKRQIGIIKGSLWHIIPPHGVRHHPGVVRPDAKQTYVEMVARSNFFSQDFSFFAEPESVTTNPDKDQVDTSIEIPSKNTHDLEAPTKDGEESPEPEHQV